MNLLAIGNSFSQDATRYLHGIAEAAGEKLTVVNLYVGGCSLKRHYYMMKEEAREYELEYNGENTGFKVSLREALEAREWDTITLQQVSHYSPDYGTYQPYLNELNAFVRSLAPKAKIGLHQTWAYEEGCKRLTEELGFRTQREMYDAVVAANEKAFAEIRPDFLIPDGMLFQELIRAGFTPVHRDTFHADLGTGRFALALCWFRILTGRSVSDNPFRAFDVPVDDTRARAVCRLVDEVIRV